MKKEDCVIYKGNFFQKMPKGEKDMAIKCMEDYLKRNPDTQEVDK